MTHSVTLSFQSDFYDVVYWAIPQIKGARFGIVVEVNATQIATEIMAYDRDVPFSAWFEDPNQNQTPKLSRDVARAIGQAIELNERV